MCVRKTATKMISNLMDLSYEIRVNECGVTTMGTRRLRGDQREVCKILNVYENIDISICLS